MHAPLRVRALSCAVALVALAGCAGPTLDVGYPDAASNRALLASVTPRKIVVPAVTDRRADQSRIGVEPVDGKPIATRPTYCVAAERPIASSQNSSTSTTTSASPPPATTS